jgi:hypothetical protein
MRAPQDEVNAAFDRPSITFGWDPGRLIKHPLLLMHPTHPTLPRNDVTTTENISVPIPPLKSLGIELTFRFNACSEDNDTPDRPSITCGWDPGRPNKPPLLLMLPTHSTLLRNDATTTVNISVSIPPLNPSASMRARQDEDNDEAPARPSIVTCGWDPGRQNGLRLLLLCPTLLHRDATTTAPNISFPPLNPSASMRARQDADKGEAPARLSIDNCGWDPGKDEVEDGLSDCETVFACPDYDDDWSIFDDGIMS